MMQLAEMIANIRQMENDHRPEGYPVVTMAFLSRMANGVEFYQRRIDLLQDNLYRMRDPECTLASDIIANGQLLPDPDGKRYGIAREDQC